MNGSNGPDGAAGMRLFWASMVATAGFLLVVVWFAVIEPDSMEVWQRVVMLAALGIFIAASLATAKIIPWTSRSLDDWRKPDVLGTVVLLLLGGAGFVTGVSTIFADEPAKEQTARAIGSKADRLLQGQAEIRKAIGDKTPSEKEERAWRDLDRSSCLELERHIVEFPQGAYIQTATALLGTKRAVPSGEWRTATHQFPITEIPDGDIAASIERSRSGALQRARRQADRLCGLYAREVGGRFKGADVAADVWDCVNGACGFEGRATCAIDEPVFNEVCGGRP